MHQTFEHPNVIQYITSKMTADAVYIFMELAHGGELFDRIGLFRSIVAHLAFTHIIEPERGVDPLAAHFYFRQLIRAIVRLSIQDSNWVISVFRHTATPRESAIVT